MISAAVVADWKMETVWKCPFCNSVVSDSRNRRRLGTSLFVDARVSELFRSVGGSKTELLPSDCVWKACFQSVEKLLKVESSSSSILDTLKASIQTALTQTISSTQSGQRGKRMNTSEHSNPPPKCPALHASRQNAFRMAACIRHQLLQHL